MIRTPSRILPVCLVLCLAAGAIGVCPGAQAAEGDQRVDQAAAGDETKAPEKAGESGAKGDEA